MSKKKKLARNGKHRGAPSSTRSFSRRGAHHVQPHSTDYGNTTNPYSRGSDPFETRRPSKKTRSFVFAGHLPQDTTRPEARGSSKRTPSLPSEDGTLVKPLSTLSMDDEHALGTSSRPKSPSSVSSGLSDGEEVLFAGRNPRAIHNNAQSEGRVTTHLSSKRAITLTKSSEPIKPSLSTPKPQDPKIKRSLNSHVDPLATAFTPPGDGKSSYQYASPIDSPYVSTSDSRPSQPPNRKPLAGDLHLNSAGNRSDRIFNFDVLGRRVPAGRSETSFPKRQRQVDSHVVPPHLRGLATFKASVDSNDVTENGTRPGDPPTSENLRTVSLKEQKRTKAKVSAKQQDPLHESRSASGIDELLEGEETDTNASLNTEDQAALDLEDAFACSLNRDTSNVSAVMEQRGYMHIQLEEGDSAEASKAADREMLISGDAFNDEYDTDYLRQAAIQFKAKSRGKGRLHGSARPTSGLDALEHDDYADFDIMDRERASIKRTSKSQPPFDLSDSELEDDILLAWENDRTRKKFKKQQREARLANDSQADGTDLRAKYPNGMVLKDVKEEIQLFLGSNRNHLAFIPMDKGRRIVMHEIANRLKIRSSSKGQGNKRYVCFWKTSKSKAFSEQPFRRMEGHFDRRESSRPVHRYARDARFPTASAGYMDGEIVGASAPELGVENRGRAMLEKMGWSNGTGLGTPSNKGILAPVPHVVKNSRTGLG